MKIIPERRLFWFLKKGVQLDLSEPSILDMYVQQVITRGKTQDVKTLLKRIDLVQLQEALGRLKHFIPNEVRDFWEDYIDINK